jgi:hypothetical protein
MAKRKRQLRAPRRPAIAASLYDLTGILDASVATLCEAQISLETGEQNAAIGAILDLDSRLADAIALHRAILVLHRYR